jgi:hypothetical protein
MIFVPWRRIEKLHVDYDGPTDLKGPLFLDWVQWQAFHHLSVQLFLRVESIYAKIILIRSHCHCPGSVDSDQSTVQAALQDVIDLLRINSNGPSKVGWMDSFGIDSSLGNNEVDLALLGAVLRIYKLQMARVRGHCEYVGRKMGLDTMVMVVTIRRPILRDHTGRYYALR